MLSVNLMQLIIFLSMKITVVKIEKKKKECQYGIFNAE